MRRRDRARARGGPGAGLQVWLQGAGRYRAGSGEQGGNSVAALPSRSLPAPAQPSTAHLVTPAHLNSPELPP